MVDQLVRLFKAVTTPQLTELAGAALIVAGAAEAFGAPAGFVTAGVALVLKAADTQRRRTPTPRP